jgi:hypothetical protein
VDSNLMLGVVNFEEEEGDKLGKLPNLSTPTRALPISPRGKALPASPSYSEDDSEDKEEKGDDDEELGATAVLSTICMCLDVMFVVADKMH